MKSSGICAALIATLALWACSKAPEPPPAIAARGETVAPAAAPAHAEHAIAWETGDAEALPYADAQFDLVTSCVGVMFAPHHQAGADELVRVCRTGGTIGVLSWTPGGFIGQLFATMKPYVPLPPPGVGPTW